MALTVSDLLTRQVLTVAPDTTLAVAAKLMSEKHFSCLIAVENGKPVGILTESDLVRIGFLQLDPTKRGIAEFLSQPVISVTTNQSIYEAFNFLLEHHVRHLVATHPDGTLDGLLTFSDILKAAEFDDFLRVKKISSVMSRKVVTLAPDDAVLKAMEIMTTMHISCVVVVGGEKGLGIFTERDAANLVGAGTDLTVLLLSDVMTTPLKTTREDESLLNAYLMMREFGFRRLVIADKADKPVGIITQFDVIRGMEGNTIRHYKALHAEVEEKLAESQKLLAEKSELERIVSASPGVLYRCEWDADSGEGVFHPTYFSSQISGMLGYEPSDFLHHEWWKTHVHPDDQDKVHACLQKIAQTGERNLMYRVGKKSGGWVWILDHARVSKTEDGTPLEMVGSWLDISERKQAEQEVNESEEKYRRLIESSNDAIFVADAETGILLDVNAQAEKMLGLPRTEIIGKHQSELHPPEEAERYRQIFIDNIHDDRAFISDVVVRRADGSDVPIDISANITEAAGRRIVQGVFRDISERKKAELSLKQSESRLLASEAISHTGTWEWDPVSGELIWSDEVYRIHGYAPGEVEPRYELFIDHLHPDDRQLVEHAVQSALNENQPYNIECRLITKDGIEKVANAVGKVDFDQAGNPVRMIGAFQDITEIKKSSQRLQHVLDADFDAVVVHQHQKVVFANKAALEMFGVSTLEDAVGSDARDYASERFRHFYDMADKRARRYNKPIGPSEIEGFRKSDGKIFPIEVIATAMEWEGEPATVTIIRDITQRKAAEREIKQAAERMQRVLDADFDAVVVHQNEKVVFANKQALAMFGYGSLNEAINRNVLEYVPEKYRKFSSRMFSRAIRRSKPVRRTELEGMSPKRESFPIEISNTPMTWKGAPAIVSIVRDISERKAAQAQLESERASLKAILNNLPFLAWLKDEEGRFQAVNDLFAKACGAENADSLAGQTDLDIWPEELAIAYRLDDQDVMDSGESKAVEEQVEVEGDKRWFETFKSPIFDVQGMVVGTAGMARDITDRINSEEQMRLLESAVSSVNETIIITNAEGIIQYVNPAFTKNTGFSDEDAIGNTPAILNSKQQTKAFYKQFWQTIKDGKPWSGRILDRRKDGTIFPVFLSVAPIVNGKGEITQFVAVHEDLSDSEAMQKKMMQSQKMEAVGTLVGGLAHDFNNLLASIVGNLYLMRNHHRDDEQTVKRIKGMEKSLQHGAKMIQQMLTFARKDRTEMDSIDLLTFTKEAYKMAYASIPENISFQLDYENNTSIWIRGDATQLQQVLLNLVTNARHAVEHIEKPEIKIDVTIAQPDELLMLDHSELMTNSGWCMIRCIDNGIGISDRDMEHIFEPFFTTKQVGEGTGLGLAMVYGAVQNHKGIIDVKSEAGKGTSVSIYLPLHERKKIGKAVSRELNVDGSGLKILIVDDEEELRHVLAEVLGYNGFTVLQAEDGEQAVELFEKHESDIALILMDVVMPNMGGVVAAKEIRNMNQSVPIIFQTGYGEKTQLEAAAAIKNSDALHKPVQIPELMKLIVLKIMTDSGK